MVTVLLIPLVLFSDLGQRFLNIPDFRYSPYVEFLFATLIFFFSFVFFQHAKHEIKSKQYGMMTLVSVAVASGYLFSAASTFLPSLQEEFYIEISTLIWVLLFGHYLEAKSSTAAGDALEEVAKLLPGEAHLIEGEESKDVDVSKLEPGQIVLVKPGEKVPADGTIIEGESNFNESHLTGESKPVRKGVDQKVVAGAISEDGAVKVKLERVGDNSTIGQIKNLVSQAQKTKPSSQKLADRAAKWLTFISLTVALITLLIWTLLLGKAFVFAVTLAITVLVITCPHALGLAIPTVTTIATRLAVKNGLFIKDLTKIEVVKDINYVVFDKTGTLTKGEFGVNEVKALSDLSTDELLKIAASLEENSSHVIALAVVKKTKDKNLKTAPVEKFNNVSGKGVEGEINGEKYILGNKAFLEEHNLSTDKLINKDWQGSTVIYLADKNNVLGAIALSDQIKDSSKQAVNRLHKMGIKVAILTGDNQKAAEEVANTLGVDKVFAEVLPNNKYEHVKSLQDEGHKVIMAGDGVNDAPALTQADVGVAIGAGTDVAVEAGDIVLTESNPLDIVKLIELSKKVYQKMLQNLFWALGYNIIAIPAAAGLFIPFGLRLTPEIGAIVMSLSSVIVVANSLTLLKTDLA
jgi:Cu2+-exporting ATPase